MTFPALFVGLRCCREQHEHKPATTMYTPTVTLAKIADLVGVKYSPLEAYTCSCHEGDKCQSPWGVVEILKASDTGIYLVRTDSGKDRLIHRDELTRIPSHADRMQAMLDVAWDVENRLQDDETVQLKVGAFVEFSRHYCEMQKELLECVNYYKSNAKSSLVVAESIEKLLKGETTK